MGTEQALRQRWWWEGRTFAATRRIPEIHSLGLVREVTPAGRVPAGVAPPDNVCTIGVADVARWIDHIEGVPQR